MPDPAAALPTLPDLTTGDPEAELDFELPDDGPNVDDLLTD